MLSYFPCPICGSQNWISHKTYSFHSVKPSDKDINVTCINYVDIRRQVLFNIWFKNQESIDLISQYCKDCGFMCYTPRPNEEDIEAKYLFLAQKERIGALKKVTERTIKLDKHRENFMFRMINKYCVFNGRKVLDVGGGDGRLMRPFLQNGFDCYVVDYNDKPYPGMKRIGSNISDVPKGMLFDTVICSHVLEHVSDPGLFLDELRPLLIKGGVIYIEVPSEIWEGIAIHIDPVTHVNFFTDASLRNALMLKGFNPLAIHKRLASYGENYKRVIWAIASVTQVKGHNIKTIYNNTKRHLFPKPIDKIVRRVENYWLKYVLNRF